MNRLAGVVVLLAGCVSASDFDGFRAGADASAAVDLAGADFAGACGACAGCCDGKQCVAFGLACGGASTVCAPSGACVPCGGPFQPCCQASTCSDGGCCDATKQPTPLCAPSGENLGAGQVCLNGVPTACGFGGSACCGEGVCHNSACCWADQCVPPMGACSGANLCSFVTAGGCGACGGLDQNCCQGHPNGGGNADFCTGGNPVSCHGGKCAQCGAAGLACCDGGTCLNGCCDHGQDGGTCVAAGTACSNGMTCAAARCGACGGLGEPPCGGAGCTWPRSKLDPNSGRCAPCGGLGELCCDGDNGGTCGEPFGCDKSSGRCAACGGVGQPCCRGSQCRSGRQCNNDVCQN